MSQSNGWFTSYEAGRQANSENPLLRNNKYPAFVSQKGFQPHLNKSGELSEGEIDEDGPLSSSKHNSSQAESSMQLRQVNERQKVSEACPVVR